MPTMPAMPGLSPSILRECAYLTFYGSNGLFFHDNRLYYAMGKNLKVDFLKIPPKAQALLEKYKSDKQKHDLIFPELRVLDELLPFEVQRKISHASKRMDKSLKETAQNLGIIKNISMHIARHTFGNISGDLIPDQMLQKLYRHSSITTTIGYQANFIYREVDDEWKLQ